MPAHHLDRSFVSRVEALVAAEHDALGADLVDEIAQRLARMADGVVVKPLEVGLGAVFEVLAFGAHRPAVVEAADQKRKGAAGVPHHIKYYEKIIDTLAAKLEVLFWTGEQILDWYKGAREQA